MTLILALMTLATALTVCLLTIHRASKDSYYDHP